MVINFVRQQACHQRLGRGWIKIVMNCSKIYIAMKKIRNTKTNEYGFASLVVAFILILVMSLMTVGFAQVARREQQNSLNSQLANQAYYAAESGVDEVRAQLTALQTAAGSGPTYSSPYDGSACLGAPYVQNAAVGSPNVGVLNSTSDVTYSCAIVNFKTITLNPPTVPPLGATNFIFNSTGALNQLTFSWGSADAVPNNTARATGGFPTQSTWARGKSPAVIQFSIVPVGNGGTITRQDLIANTFTAYFYPSGGVALPDPEYPSATTYVGSVNYASPDGYNGTCETRIPPSGNCDDSSTSAPIVYATNTPANDPYPFSVIIKNLPAATNNTWLVHYTPFYDATTSCLDAAAVTGCSNTSPIALTNSEVDIDVTGKAKNVVKRIEEVVPLPTSNSSYLTQNGISTLPAFAINSGSDLCKQFATNPATPGAGTLAATAGTPDCPAGF